MDLRSFLITYLLLLGFGNARSVLLNDRVVRPGGFREFYSGHARRDLPRGTVIPLSRRAGTFGILPRGSNTTNSSAASSAPLTAIALNLLANVSIGGQVFQLLVDTGSSDTWVAATNFKCVDIQEKPKQQSTCKIPTLYTQPSTAEAVPGVMLSQGYASGEFVFGPMVLETVSIGGITVQKSQVGAVTTAFWNGDGLNGGLLGLSGSVTTTAVDAKKNQAVYDPVFLKMIQQNVTKPFFSMSIDTTQSGPAGFLVFGGLPPVAHSDNFTTVPIIKKTSSFQGPLPSPQVVDYIVPVSSFTVGGKNIKMNKLEMVVDSGTFANIVPDGLANQINDQWSPPAVFDNKQGLFKIDCAATAPDVGITMNGTTFVMKSAAAVQKDGTNCFSAWAGGGTVGNVNSTFVLGDVFMKSVVSVFDLGTTEMHFAARV
ncbi:hypothetical protein IFR05_013286 [Cadophora sp. M221]|nr:hypothetical protein IFR05_013286 [Cadophora sp. M221]